MPQQKTHNKEKKMYLSAYPQVGLSLRQIPNYYPETFLYYLEEGDLEAIEFHLDHGQDPNEPLGEKKDKPIYIVEKMKSLDILKLLLKNGATYTLGDYEHCCDYILER